MTARGLASCERNHGTFSAAALQSLCGCRYLRDRKRFPPLSCSGGKRQFAKSSLTIFIENEIIMSNEEQGKKMDQLIAKCWADDGFKQKLLADPAATLKAEGVALPAGLTVKALENTDSVFHLVIPAKPTALSDEDLDKVAAGGGPSDEINRVINEAANEKSRRENPEWMRYQIERWAREGEEVRKRMGLG